MRKLATENIAEDLRIAMRVGRETIPGSDAIFIENAKRSEIDEAVVHVPSEAECVVGFEPAAVLSISALARAAEGDLCVGKWVCHDYYVDVGLISPVT
jgi:hypothetical protein